MAEYGFIEINGSNAMTIDANGVAQSTRIFVGPWSKRFLFAGLMSKQRHPDAVWAYPTKIDIKPLLGDNEKAVRLPDTVARRAIEYPNALVTIEYGVRPDEFALWPNGIPVPDRRRGTVLELRTDAGGEFLKIDNAQWGDNLSEDPYKQVPQGDSAALRLYVPQHQFDIVWHYVDDVPTADLDKLIGRVNSKEFLGKPKGTLLMNSYGMTIETTLDLVRPIRWAVSVSITYRGVKVGKQTYGWNYELRQDGWKEVYVRGEGGAWTKRYEEADFTYMFM